MESEIVEKPWGSYKVVAQDANYLVKILTVNPRRSLSLQQHKHREEYWFILKGKPFIRIEDKVYLDTKRGDNFHVPILTTHCIENPTNDVVSILEIQTGIVLSEDDIERLIDPYNR